MKIVIIEDEIKAAKSLEALIAKVRPESRIEAKLQSIETAVDYLSRNGQPDLLFMDVQLSDGLSFEIFKAVKVLCPVVFCTAYGEYAMEAIKANGIDYLLKPFSREDLEAAFEKVETLKNFFQQHSQSDLDVILKRIGQDEGKKSFLVFRDNKYTTIATETIAFFCIRYDSTTIYTLQGQAYPISQSMDQVQAQVSSKQFYRLNRQYLINFSAIKEVEHYSARKLFVKLTVKTPDELLIGKEKTTPFMEWLENR